MSFSASVHTPSCALQLPPSLTCAEDVPFQFTVELKDFRGRPVVVAPQEANLSIVPGDGGRVESVQWNGALASVALTGLSVKTHTVRVYRKGVDIPGSPFNVVVR